MIGTVALVLRLLMAAALYVFLGLAMWYIWLGVSRSSDRIAARSVVPIRLVAEDAKGSVFERSFSRQEIMIGRDPRAEVALSDDAASARHAQLSFHHGHWWLVDLGSKNGTRLNRTPVTSPTVLTDGDEIRCGQSRVRVHLAELEMDRQAPAGASDE